MPVKVASGNVNRALRCFALFYVVFRGCHRLPRSDFGCFAETGELPAAYEIGPGAAWVVGEPEAVGGDDDVEALEHEAYFRAGNSRSKLRR